MVEQLPNVYKALVSSMPRERGREGGTEKAGSMADLEGDHKSLIGHRQREAPAS